MPYRSLRGAGFARKARKGYRAEGRDQRRAEHQGHGSGGHPLPLKVPKENILKMKVSLPTEEKIRRIEDFIATHKGNIEIRVR